MFSIAFILEWQIQEWTSQIFSWNHQEKSDFSKNLIVFLIRKKSEFVSYESDYESGSSVEPIY